MSLNNKIKQLEQKILELESKVKDLSKNTEETYKTPITIVGGNSDRSFNRPIDIKTGMSRLLGGGMVWNDTELTIPRSDQEPDIPTKGYNKHSHSRFSGGALIKGVIEIVEYVWESITNKHSQQYWQEEPEIATTVNSQGETVEKIGQLDLVFNADTGKFGTPSYEVDVEKCYLVKRRTTTVKDVNGDPIPGQEVGDIKLDDKGNEMKSSLYSEDANKTSIVWDKNARVWRFYATYSPEPAEEEE